MSIVTLRKEDGENFFVITVPSILNYDPQNDHPTLTTRGRLLTEKLEQTFPGIALEYAKESTFRMRRGTHDPTEWASVSHKNVLETIRSHQPRIVLVMAGSLPSQFFLQTSWPLTTDEITMLNTKLDANVTTPRIPGWQHGTLHQLVRKLGGCKIDSRVIAAYLEAEINR